MSLKSFIKAVRAAKTAADERTVIQKESAAIRTSFRDERTTHAMRRVAIAKLLYLFTLGERTHFGQVECLKLLASQHFTDKRLGYLGTMLLLDENQEVLMLLTNSLDTDLNHPNQYVVSLALCTLANIASQDMARDLHPKIEKLIGSSNAYIKKKAALCALRIVRKVPELEELFVDHCKLLLSDSSHGVLLCGCSLAIDLLDNNPQLVVVFEDQLPSLVTLLKSKSTSGYSPEFDVQGVPDPFLQTRVLRLLRAIGQDNRHLSEQMSDILAAVATNTDASKNVGNAVLYETVLTIFGIDADSSLRVLAINILGKLLVNKGNNARYVALNTLNKVVALETAAVQRHRTTIIECFQDPDISIRRRALELSYALINAQNVRVIVRELVLFLESCELEFKQEVVSQIALAAERFAPTKRWHIDTLLRTFELAGNYTKENVISAFILIVIGNPDLQLYTLQKLFASLGKDFSQYALTVASVWLLGEYADVLLQAGDFESTKVNQETLVTVILDVMNSLYANQVVREYTINALVKLSVRISSAKQLERIRKALDENSRSLDAEVQQRAVEYAVLLRQDPLRKGVLARIPAPDNADDLDRQHAKAMSRALVMRRKRMPISQPGQPKFQSKTASAHTNAPQTDLLDLDGEDAPVQPTSPPANTGDLLADIFGSQPQKQPHKASTDILELFGQNTSQTTSQTTSQKTDEKTDPNAAVAYSDAAIKLSFAASRDEPGRVTLRAIYDNVGAAQIDDVTLQVALPKSQRLSLQPLSKRFISAGQKIEQHMSVTGPVDAAIRLRLRLAYSTNGTRNTEQFDFSLDKGV